MVVEGFITGLHKSPFHGFSVEFSQHKAYNPGDSLRFVDWKVFARTDRYYIKQYEEETNLRCYIVLDISKSMEFGEGVFEVKSTSGDTQLGGTDMDNAMVDFIIKDFKSKENIDLSDDATATQRLKEAAEKAKIELSTTLETDINLPFITSFLEV